MDKKIADNVIRNHNPWRHDEGMGYLKPPAYRRAIFNDIRDVLMKERRAPLLTGSFGVGKTTLLLQLIEWLLTSGTAADKIIYLSLNEPAVWGDDVSFILNELLSRFGDNPEGCYLFLDDCHLYPEVYKLLVASYRDYPGVNIVFADEPAANTGTERGISERLNRIKVSSFSFADYFFLDLTKREGFDKVQVIKTGYQNVKTDFYRLFTRHFSGHIDGLPILSLIEKGASDILALLNEKLPIDITMDDGYSEHKLFSYLSAGGLPALWAIGNPLKRRDYVVRNYIEPAVRGALDFGGSIEPGIVKRIIYTVLISSGSETNLRKIAKSANAKRGEAGTVLSYLRRLGLLPLIYRYGVANRRSTDDFVPALFDVGLFTVLNGAVTSDEFDRNVPRSVILNLIHNQIVEWDDVLTATYFRDENKHIPGFIALLDSGRELPVFIYNGSAGDTEKELAGFIEERDITYGILVTESGETKFENRILHIPLHRFLMFFTRG